MPEEITDEVGVTGDPIEQILSRRESRQDRLLFHKARINMLAPLPKAILVVFVVTVLAAIVVLIMASTVQFLSLQMETAHDTIKRISNQMHRPLHH